MTRGAESPDVKVSGVAFSLPLMNSFNKTEAAIFSHASYAS